ncbi:MAG: FG-GAP repeat protein [Ignavibacteria bacterium]|nr:FG-GAP repeat protein [Ignavibacteria bacterium]
MIICSGWTKGSLTISFLAASGAGDVNGDGFDDIIFSTPKRGPHGEGMRIYIMALHLV